MVTEYIAALESVADAAREAVASIRANEVFGGDGLDDDGARLKESLAALDAMGRGTSGQAVYVVRDPYLRSVHSTPGAAIDAACRWESLHARVRAATKVERQPIERASVHICWVDGRCQIYAVCFDIQDGIEVCHEYEWPDGQQIERRPFSDLTGWGFPAEPKEPIK